MFFANIFSYRQRKRLCAQAFNKTRRNLQSRAAELAPVLARHGISFRLDRLHDTHRHVTDAVSDPRPLHADAAASPTVCADGARPRPHARRARALARRGALA